MKKLICLLIIVISFNSLLQAQKIVIKIKGSDTCLPLSQKEVESFIKKNPGSSISVTGGGSGVGFSALLNGTTDIAQASRKIKMDEKLKMQEAGKSSYKEVIIAYDALTVIVNPANKISKLNREQLEGIFTGKITNWKEVGGDDMNIVVYSRESSSGTYDFFKEHVLNNKNFSKSALMMPATGAIVQSVSQTKGAIGYIGIAYLEKNVKALDVSYDKGKSYVKPSIANAKNKSYPIVRPLYYYYLNSSESKVKAFIDFVLSLEGQKIVNDEGYISIK